MMSDNQATPNENLTYANGNQSSLAALFKLDEQESTQSATSVQDENVQVMKKQIAEQTKGIPVPPALHEKLFDLMITKLSQALEKIKVGPHILAKAWSQSDDLQKYRDPQKYPPDETFMVPMVDHEVESEHNPAIELKLKQNLLGAYEFEVVVVFEIKGVVLHIQDGKIMKMKIGSCSAVGEIGYSAIRLFETPESREVRLGTVDLGEGVPIVEKPAKSATTAG